LTFNPKPLFSFYCQVPQAPSREGQVRQAAKR